MHDNKVRRGPCAGRAPDGGTEIAESDRARGRRLTNLSCTRESVTLGTQRHESVTIHHRQFVPAVAGRLLPHAEVNVKATSTIALHIGICLLAMTGAAFAQEGEITGTVTDSTGGVLPGASVEASGPALPGGRRSAVTDLDGRYTLTALPPGAYELAYSMPGFERAQQSVVEVVAGMTTMADASLTVGGIFEQVTVAVTGTAIAAPAIDMPHAVAVVSRETLEQQGSTQLVDLFKNLSISHGVIGERNSWYNSNQPSTLTENVANVNLRGLGGCTTRKWGICRRGY